AKARQDRNGIRRTGRPQGAERKFAVPEDPSAQRMAVEPARATGLGTIDTRPLARSHHRSLESLAPTEGYILCAGTHQKAGQSRIHKEMLMLGEILGESHGKRTARRVLATSPRLKLEVSFEDSGQILGNAYNGITTYWAESRPDGSLYGEG